MLRLFVFDFEDKVIFTYAHPSTETEGSEGGRVLGDPGLVQPAVWDEEFCVIAPHPMPVQGVDCEEYPRPSR